MLELLATVFLLFPSLEAQSSPKAPDPPPKPVEPPHKPAQQGFRFAATVGLGLIANGKYGYDTIITMPDGNEFFYKGTHRAAGGTLSFGVAVTPSGALRRFTIGFDANFGGLDVSSNPVVPSGAPTPFSQGNLSDQIAIQSLMNASWHPFFSGYIEHALGSIWDNRLGFGYEYMQASGSSHGWFAADQTGSVLATYSVRFSEASHMLRLSVHNDIWFDDTESGKAPPRRRSGIIQQGGVLVGIDGSIIAFCNFGPVWSF